MTNLYGESHLSFYPNLKVLPAVCDVIEGTDFPSKHVQGLTKRRCESCFCWHAVNRGLNECRFPELCSAFWFKFAMQPLFAQLLLTTRMDASCGPRHGVAYVPQECAEMQARLTNSPLPPQLSRFLSTSCLV